ncbi:MAG: helix-turn-helix transcriptional regulator [Acidobacteriota bacterium]
MPGVHANKLDKREIGTRIKQLRMEAGLRQWQLAELIGATQPAIHMYERGVLPEPRRLLELARIGHTTVEWILTGRHWENGSEQMRRVPQDVCRLAFHLSEFDDDERETLGSALRIIRSAVGALKKVGRDKKEDEDTPPAGELTEMLKESPNTTLGILASALKIHRAVLKTVVKERLERFHGSRLTRGGEISSMSGAAPEPGPRPKRIRSSSIEMVRGNIFRLDGSLLAINDILKDRELRAELEESIDGLIGRLESKRSKSVKKRAQRAR